MRPLDFLGRIKVKLGIVIVLAVVAAFVVNEVGINSGLTRDLRIAIAVALAMVMVQFLARGMIRPLREMAAAAQTIAKGRYGLRVTATSRDEVGELARAFNAMAADLAEVDRQRRDLVANVSHELRTPIAGLQAVLENVVDGVSPPDLDTLGTALAQTQRLGRLVAQLLDLSRLDSGARLIEPENLDLASLCRQAVSEASIARDDVTVESAVPPGTVLAADPALLAQVLANLLDNAVRHSPPGGRVRVETRAAGPALEISVIDDGPGIPPGERARVFERFSRLDAGRAADAGGAGLGLAIAKEIAELHGGTITVADPPPERAGHAPAGGCRMVVALPRHRDPATVEGPDAPLHAGERRGTMNAKQAGEGRPGDQRQTAGPPAPREAGLHEAGLRNGALVDGALTDGGAERGAVAAGHAERHGVVPAAPAEAGVRDGLLVDGNAERGVGTAGHGEPPGVVSAVPASPASPVRPDGDSAREHARDDVRGGTRGAGRGEEHRQGVMASWEEGRMGRGPADPPADSATDPPVTWPYAALAQARAGRSARAALGAGLGMVGGFLAGLIAAAVLGVYGEGLLGAAAILLFTVGGAAAGAAFGSSPVHRYSGAPHGTQQGTPGEAPQEETPWSEAPAYVPPPLFPRPDLPDAPRWLLPAAAAAGLVAAVALPYASAGLGSVLTAVALGAAAFPAVLPRRRGRLTAWTVALGLLAYALVAVALFRDAEWLVAPVLLAAFAVGSLALSGGGRGWLGVIRGGISVVFAMLPVPWFLAGPVRDLARRSRVLPTLVGAAVTVVLLGVFGLLFASADAVFSAFVGDLLRTPDWAWDLPYRIFVFCVFAVLAVAAVLVGLRPVAEPAPPDLRMPLGRQVWMIPLVGLNLLFAAFVTVQITVLFGGSRRVLSTAGLTYAEYARSGFFELVTVSVFVLGIVAGAVALLRRQSRADRRLLAALLGLLCAFTLVVLASALHRLGLYTDAYGLSRLRASVEATIWWLGAVFVLVLAAGAVRLTGGGAGWFFRGLVLLTGVSLLAFAVWDPDARVAETQLTIRGVERLDHGYLGDLGAEAVPILDRLPEPDRSCVLRDVVAANRLDRPDSWNDWNLARARARQVLAKRPALPGGDCPSSDRGYAYD
ncbi:DUF4173 domain-containing protein [Microbispora cellulosiformans]|uniref:Signal transduction histidine-protein kinase/phosphatase MprB n=1 Tax=Microbispora cellulosiformans TaxID=2614688 RepID=A0A5J5KC93_9ACTN|nr:DUF4153 domain-containing protein [Microbispora cellulosiformans]KAA9381438.1 DUF4173 domain-containing protein [Microbispora cellulosiformans]